MTALEEMEQEKIKYEFPEELINILKENRKEVDDEVSDIK